ncbi:E3 ubiquitin-protein ligase MARCH7 [Scaptodrosophila lebanonensis]|uniref:E3 ubiquitin-protein ligase MARCH7 n=1 Tax=Drosophila lebanonensis TaxID=7225 RepID=A0A6J2TWY1_DROLE|nr:E3 ubiquitin-protein ligase MARCH7 [Scaptodrosophila lebanonensis]
MNARHRNTNTNTNTPLFDLPPPRSRMPSTQRTLSEATAIRLFNSVVGSAGNPGNTGNTATTPENATATGCGNACGSGSNNVTTLGVLSQIPAPAYTLQESVHSANEFGNSCRICRWNRSDMEIISCPCNCKGSVGYIHMKCLKRWIMHQRDNRCEICHAIYDISEDRLSFKQMLKTFCCGRCCGLIVKHLLFSASLMPLAHVILQQVLQCMDNLNQGSTEQLSVQEVFVASCALLTSSALFFHFFEFVTTRCLLIRNILRHWWMFGSTSDYALVEIDDDSIDLF